MPHCSARSLAFVWIPIMILVWWFSFGGCRRLPDNGVPERRRGDLVATDYDLQIRFYNTDGPGKPLDERVYQDTFRHDTAQRIAWELSLRGPPMEKDSMVEIAATWRFDETELIDVQTVFLNVTKHQTDARISASWRPWTTVGWTPGRYSVELVVNQVKRISGHFNISPSTRYQPSAPVGRPILKLNTVNHHASLNDIETDAANRYLVTASNDKTVRLWDLNRHRLLRVLRPPIATGAEGRLRTVAISPGGESIACGGRTGGAWNMSFVVYVFDRARATLVQTLKGFPKPIQDLAFSRDGQFLVVFYRDGLRLYSYPGWKLLDQQMTSCRWITRADVNAKNDIALATFDGHLLIYTIVDSRLVHKITRRTKSGRKPLSVKYSPDNKTLVVAFRDTKDIDVYAADSLDYLYSPIGAGIDRFLVAAVWSHDGQSIYAGGVHEEYTAAGNERAKMFPIFRWDRKGRGRRESIPIGAIGIHTLHALGDGRLIYGLYDGTWGILNRHHRKDFIQPTSILHFRKSRKRSRISADASKVYFQYDLHRDSGFVLDIRRGRVIPWHAIAGKQPMVYPRVHHSNLDIRRWKHKRFPRLDGKPLFYHPAEISRCLAIKDDGTQFILGTNHNIYCFRQTGEKVWRVPVPSVTRAVNLSANGDIVVAHVGDGTIRWLRMRDGKEFLAFYPHPDRKRWIAWTPEGYYMCSPRGDDLIGWHRNNGKDQAADFYTAAQFERLLYMPHYVKTSFERRGDRGSMIRENQGLQFSISDLASILPPRITIEHPEPGFVNTSETIRLKFKVQRTCLPLKDYTVYVNNIPVTLTRDRTIRSGLDRLAHEIDLPLHENDNTVRIESTSGQSMGLAETHFHTTRTAPAVKGDLYLLAIGINQFRRMPTNNLSFAVNDAEKLAERFRAEDGRTFRRVHLRTITDNSRIKPTKREIINQLAFFKAAGPYDTSILFLASHGLSDNAGNYYLVPCDGSFADIDRMAKVRQRGIRPVEAVYDSLVGWRNFFDIFRVIPGKRLLVVDTCHSQAISGTLDMYSLAKRSASSSFALMTAAKDNEASQEFPAIRHGLFTYALLQGLAGEGNRDDDRRILLSELYRYTFDFVTRHHNAQLGSQTPQIECPAELMTMVLGIDAAGNRLSP